MSATSIAPAGALFIVMNAGSGHNDTASTRAIIEAILTQAGRAYRLVVVEEAARLADIARRTVEEAKAGDGVVVVAGGDGTINTVASALLGSGCPLGVLPQGTFNYFARTHGIPEDTAEATRALLTARVHPVQVGLVNDRLFLVNASLGLYPEMLEDREAFKQRFGRSRLVAIWAGIATALKPQARMRITLQQHGRTSRMRSLTLFVGNNPLQLERVGIPLADELREGHLVAIALQPIGRLALLWLLLRGALGRLGDAENLTSFGFAQMTVGTSSRYRKRRVKVATDGEVISLAAPLDFRVSPQPLYLLKPDPVSDPTLTSQAPTGGRLP
ncbi:diacylglycerol kinase family protein [soil metagenome]